MMRTEPIKIIAGIVTYWTGNWLLFNMHKYTPLENIIGLIICGSIIGWLVWDE